MNIAQIILVSLLVLSFFVSLYWDVNGRRERAPLGFAGVVGTVLIYTATVVLYYYAGVFGA